jgi:ATP-dependent DNA helicase RecG
VHADTPIAFLKGVGQARAELFHKLGIHTALDLLYHIPYRYEDATTITPSARLRVGMDATVLGKVISKGIIPTRKGLRIFQAVIEDDSGVMEIAWPGKPFLDRSIARGNWLLLSGPVRFYHGRQLTPREYVNLGDDYEAAEGGRVLSVYRATEGLSFRAIRLVVSTHLDTLIEQTSEHLPGEYYRDAGLPELRQALRMVHRPDTLDEAIRGRNRLAFDELLCVHILHRRANQLARSPRAGIRFVNRRRLTRALKESLTYRLTGAQVRAIREIFEDMCSERRMHRLLQGDVGSGKTIVALFAALLALENGMQVALMVPTELLAEQHYLGIRQLLHPLGVEPLFLSGNVSASARRVVARRMAGQSPELLIGTHALIQESVGFGNLGLVVIDEQQRFGVEQRAALSEKSPDADALLLSATPIPRSLALTIYGDLDVTILDEKPPGRNPITTVLRPESARRKVLDFVDSEVATGRQAYVVYPVIEESEKIDLKAATTMCEQLSAGPFSRRKLGLLHGRLPSDERDRAMRAFRDGSIDVLVATTVVEVGIDVPNATVMLIEHPERFGLSQLHQLRGRVGRGASESFCILLGSPGQEAQSRLRIFASTDDGFEISRADLRIRGMGDLFGQRQSGDALFRIADPVRDEELNIRAREFAEQIMTRDPELVRPEHAGLKRLLAARYARALELFRVG